MQAPQAVIAGRDALDGLARQWLAQTPVKAWFIDGDLGAGKTTLVQALCHALGVEDAVASPTFSLVHTYRSPAGPVHHIDLYRLASLDEALDAGLLDYIDADAYCFVEWAERLPELRPDTYLHLQLTALADGSRLATMELHHDRT